MYTHSFVFMLSPTIIYMCIHSPLKYKYAHSHIHVYKCSQNTSNIYTLLNIDIYWHILMHGYAHIYSQTVIWIHTGICPDIYITISIIHLYTCLHRQADTHTHIYIYIYIYINGSTTIYLVCVSVCIHI